MRRAITGAGRTIVGAVGVAVLISVTGATNAQAAGGPRYENWARRTNSTCQQQYVQWLHHGGSTTPYLLTVQRTRGFSPVPRVRPAVEFDQALSRLHAATHTRHGQARERAARAAAQDAAGRMGLRSCVVLAAGIRPWAPPAPRPQPPHQRPPHPVPTTAPTTSRPAPSPRPTHWTPPAKPSPTTSVTPTANPVTYTCIGIARGTSTSADGATVTDRFTAQFDAAGTPPRPVSTALVQYNERIGTSLRVTRAGLTVEVRHPATDKVTGFQLTVTGSDRLHPGQALGCKGGIPLV